MQELLGRITRLDPEASQALRVIACFDELSVGGVNTRGLLSAAAALAGCVAGFSKDQPPRTMRITPKGEHATGLASTRTTADATDGITVWLERAGEPAANDAIILERLALAIRMRHGRGHRDVDGRRQMGLLLDHLVPEEDRRLSAATLGLSPSATYRVAVAPLFAVWTEHPIAPEDVVASVHGPLHALVVPAATTTLAASPCGIGGATKIEHLHHSFRTALVALRLCDPPSVPVVTADEFAGLVDLLADAPHDAHRPDVDLIDKVVAHPWGACTLDAVVRSGTARQAARLTNVHHSTMQTRIDCLTADLGFDPLEGYGRVRVGVAYLAWRLQRSRVLDLPAPVHAPATRSEAAANRPAS